MKLIKCYIENFGTLHDFSYHFSDGLNAICHENGWGKTTFAVFVKAMFYGLEYAPRKRVAENERKKYDPWNGGNFGGSLEFEVKGKQYKIERYFGKKEKEDSFFLYDMKTGLISRDYSEKIGEEIFHIDMTSYERSTYIPQNGISIQMTDSINAKLSNLVENGNDINNYENACAKLEERLREYKKTGGRGRIAQLQEQIHTKQDEIEECRNKAAGMALIEEQIEEQMVQKRGFEIKRSSLKEAVLKASAGKERAAKQEHYESLQKHAADITERKAPYDEIFGEVMPEDEKIGAIGQHLEELRQLEQDQAQARLNEEEEKQLEELDEFFGAGCPEMAQIEMYLGESRQSVNIRNEIIRLRASLEVLSAQKEQEKKRILAEVEKEKEQQKAAFEAAKEQAETARRIFLTLGILLVALGAGSFLTPVPILTGMIVTVTGIVLLLIAVTRKPKEAKLVKTVLHEQPYAGESEETYSKIYRKEMEELEADLVRLSKQEEEMKAHYLLFAEQFAVKDLEENPIQVLTEIKAKAVEYQKLSVREAERRQQKEYLTEKISEKLDLIQKELEEIHPKYTAYENLRAGYEQLAEDKKEYLRLQEELERSRTEQQTFYNSNKEILFHSVSQPETFLMLGKAHPAASLEDLQEQEKKNEIEIEAMNEKINSYRKDMDAMSVIVDMQTDIEEELESLQNELSEAQYQCRILEMTMQYLKEAKESFSTHYMGAMRKGFQKYASWMNGSKAMDIRLDVQLDAQQEIGGSLKGSEYFSTGNRDLIGICIRLALIEALFEEERPFIILDDPFVNLDDEKVENAGNLLHEIAKEYQIIYLVCHSSRGVWERGNGG